MNQSQRDVESEPGRLESSRPVLCPTIALGARALVPLFALLLLTSAASAQEGLSLRWNDCASSGSAASNIFPVCASQDREQLFISFSLGQPADSVIALEAVIDVQSAAISLPEWWRYDPNGCRYGMLTASADFSGFSACADFWTGEATLGGPPGFEPRGTNQGRIFVTFDVLSNRRRSLAAATPYYAARLVFQNEPAPTCPGCNIAACMVLNSIRLITPPGTQGGDVVITAPAALGSNQATWNGIGASCATVPVRRHTWGQLKSLYR